MNQLQWRFYIPSLDTPFDERPAPDIGLPFRQLSPPSLIDQGYNASQVQREPVQKLPSGHSYYPIRQSAVVSQFYIAIAELPAPSMESNYSYHQSAKYCPPPSISSSDLIMDANAPRLFLYSPQFRPMRNQLPLRQLLDEYYAHRLT